MTFPRTSGILLHPTSLPSPLGVGDLGVEAYRFIDFLAQSGQRLWQVLPLGPTGYGNSPYMCYSAIAGNPLLISLEKLQHQGHLESRDLEALPEFDPDRVEFDRVISIKLPLLQTACNRFRATATTEQIQEFDHFCQQSAVWLEDYALFMALKQDLNNASWHHWPESLAKRHPEALAKARITLEKLVFFQKYMQFVFFQQWSELKRYANQQGIQIIGDIPIYVAHDSADVWGNPENFCLDQETGEAAFMAGVPPDYFSQTGQLWGNPVYNWEHLQESNFAWWVRRFQAMLGLVDLIRVDHFRGFQAYWAVPQGEKTAEQGTWVEAPGEALFEALRQQLGSLPILAEDLGVITPEVVALRDRFDFPGMKVLQFGFGSDRLNPFLPYNHDHNFVVYTGTHDNDTTVGWFQKSEPYERDRLLTYIGSDHNTEEIHWAMIRLALASVAKQAIIPLQDVLGLDGSARMNLPGSAEGNWGWRYRGEWLTKDLGQRLKKLTEIYGRGPLPGH